MTYTSIEDPIFALSNQFLKSSTTSLREPVTSLILSCKKTIFLLKVGTADLYPGGTQHTRRSPMSPPTSQIHPSSLNLNNLAGDAGKSSPVAHGGQCSAGRGKRPWSVTMDLWPSKKAQKVVRCIVSHSKRSFSSFVDLAEVTSQTCSTPCKLLVSSRVPSAAQAIFA